MFLSDAFVVGSFRIAVCVLGAALGSCQPHGGSTANPVTSLPSEGELASLPLGDVAGAAESTLGQTIKNPYENNKEAISEGHRTLHRHELRRLSWLRRNWRHGAGSHGQVLAIWGHASVGVPINL